MNLTIFMNKASLQHPIKLIASFSPTCASCNSLTYLLFYKLTFVLKTPNKPYKTPLLNSKRFSKKTAIIKNRTFSNTFWTSLNAILYGT
jgi:hypothetical protein